MRLDFVFAENVHHFRSPRFQVIRNKRAMTTLPNRFRAHDSRAPRSDGFPAVTLISTAAQAFVPCKGKQSLDSFLELLRLHVIGITSERGVAPSRIARVGFRLSFAAKL